MAKEVKDLKAFQSMPTLKSVDTEWIKWADLVIGKYGTDIGKQIFIKTWEKRGSRDANTRTIRLHLKDKYNIEIDESVWDKIVDVGGGIGDSLGRAFKVGKITLYVVGGVIVLSVGLALFNAIKTGRVPSVRGGIRK